MLTHKMLSHVMFAMLPYLCMYVVILWAYSFSCVCVLMFMWLGVYACAYACLSKGRCLCISCLCVMYVCLYFYVCTGGGLHTHACVNIRLYACVHTCLYACMYECMRACVDERMYACMCVWMYACMNVRTYEFIHVCNASCRHMYMYVQRIQRIGMWCICTYVVCITSVWSDYGVCTAM